MTKNKQTHQQTNQQHKNQKKHSLSDNELTFLEHVRELRSRLFWVVLTVIIASAIGFQAKDVLIDVVMSPLHGEKLVYLTPGGGFGFIFTLCIYFGVLVAIPVIIYHIYRFLQPLLESASRRFVATFILLSTLLATVGTVFGYYVAIPAALSFLTTFAGDAVTPNLTADSYLSFVVAYVLGLAALFQIPLLLFLFDHIRPIPPGGLSASQRYVIIGAAVAAAIITPTPDAVNMAIIAVPIVVIYELGVVAVFVRQRIRSKKSARLTRQTLNDEQLRQQAHMRRVALERKLSEPLPEVAPVPQPVFAKTVPIQQRRTMDGFAVGMRPTPMTAALPKPIAQPRSNVIARPVTVRRRSLDGFSM